MEQDCITGLYRSLGLSVGAEFSSEDVSRLFSKVFHVSSNTDEASVAMEKIAGDDSSWCCVGENVLEVVLEMEREREKKDKLYWDLQLLNIGNLNPPYATDEPVINNPHIRNTLNQSSEAINLRKAHNRPKFISLHPGTSPQRERLIGNKELCHSVRVVRKLKKAAGQSWMRLVSEGVQSILACPMQDESLGVGCQVWGCVSLSDVLLLVEVKYDVVTHLLYTEMLQEHFTPSIWGTLMPWQQQQEEEELEYLAEKALESGDMLSLAELPGAFRIYRTDMGPSFTSHSETRAASWSAVSFLHELKTLRQQEKDSLVVLGQRLDREDLRLVCLYIRLAILKAQRESVSYNAFLAAQHSWEAWPHVRSPCRAEQAALWLHSGEEEQKENFIPASPQQAVLQLLVLTQEQERKHLIKLIQGVSRGDLQEPGCTIPHKGESVEQTALRNSCITRLKQVYTDLQTQTNPQPQRQPELQMDHMSSELEMWSKHQLEDCCLLLLTKVMELQEVQVSKLLPALMDKSAQSAQALQNKLESTLHAHCFTLKLLVSEAPSPNPKSNQVEKDTNEQIPALASCSRPVDAQTSSGGSVEALTVDPIRRGSRELCADQAVDDANKQDVCAGCEAMMEDLPYLEILCVSDGNSKPDHTAEEEVKEEDEKASALKSTQNLEKQGSLITLAWSKLPDDDTDCEAEAVDGFAGQNQDAESSLKTQDHQSHVEDQSDETSRERDRMIQSASMNHRDEQVTSDERALANPSDQGEGVSQTGLQAHHYIDPSMIEQLPFNLCSTPTNETDTVDRSVAEVEMCPAETESEELWDLKGTELVYAEDQNYDSPATADDGPAMKEKKRDPSLIEREQATEPVSAVERERTMRNLVDMQRKVEQKQQRDRERQLLRVQERLSIIQNRKADEDLLGLKSTDRLKHLTQDLPQEDKNQQKTVVKERLEQLRRERSYIMQSKRERNTAGFKELLGPVTLRRREPDDGAD
ncbi:uncharacterized protein LOC117814889 isoform X1 [Xyrichtys novacula]|uniref:Uncharacterized protein LOC117814889 isoform X1 n=1 Tax=Xyrichtys novacula TaxID=13765 RepID=A0AAV1F7K5_XYRNO|nr:uncharacterized protein LOC117814889 isoform X1 [Xyrichtys novacula]